MSRLVLLVSTFTLAGAAFAGTSVSRIAQTDGTVLVNQGKQFITAQPNQVLAVGDRIMVMEGGKASIQFADGCVQNIASGTLGLMTTNATCGSGIKITQISANSAQAVGATERDCDDDGIADSKDPDVDGDGVLNADDKYESCKGGAVETHNTGIWIVGGLAAAGAALLISDGDDEEQETISP